MLTTNLWIAVDFIAQYHSSVNLDCNVGFTIVGVTIQWRNLEDALAEKYTK